MLGFNLIASVTAPVCYPLVSSFAFFIALSGVDDVFSMMCLGMTRLQRILPNGNFPFEVLSNTFAGCSSTICTPCRAPTFTPMCTSLRKSTATVTFQCRGGEWGGHQFKLCSWSFLPDSVCSPRLFCDTAGMTLCGAIMMHLVLEYVKLCGDVVRCCVADTAIRDCPLLAWPDDFLVLF